MDTAVSQGETAEPAQPQAGSTEGKLTLLQRDSILGSQVLGGQGLLKCDLSSPGGRLNAQSTLWRLHRGWPYMPRDSPGVAQAAFAQGKQPHIPNTDLRGKGRESYNHQRLGQVFRKIRLP